MASVSGDFKEGGQWTATASSFSGNQTVSLSADVNPLSKVRTADLTISAAGISKSCTVSLTQEASVFESELTVVAIPAFAAGGGTYDSIVGTGHVVVKRNDVVIVDNDVRPVFLFKAGVSVSWITFSSTATSFTVANRALDSGGPRSVTIRAQYTLDVGGVNTLLECDVPISQAANFVDTVSVSDASFAYSTIAAKGATVTPTTDSTIKVTMSSGSTLSSASAIAGYTYVLTPSFSMTNGSGFTLNSTTTGSLTAASMGTTLGSRQSPTITYSLSLTYTPSSELSALGAKTVSGSDSSTGKATQGVNEVTSSRLAVTAFHYQGTVAASGGTSVAPNITVQKNRVYTSGATDSVHVTTYTKTFRIVNDYDSGATLDTSTGLVTFPSRGTTVGLLLNIQVGLVVSADGLSVYSQAGCTQAMNKIESFVVMDISFDWPQFSPAGESHLPTHVGEWCQATYSSGVTGERAKPPVGYTIASNTAVYSMAESSSVFTIVDASTGEVSAANMGTTLGSRTSPYIWKDITIVLAAGSWAAGTVDNISGTGRARNVANQGVNAVGFRDLTITSFAYSATPTVAASGGTSVPTLAATETQTYTSGSVVSDVPVTGGSFALTTSGHGASVDSSTGVVTYASRGSVAGDAWSDSVTWTLTSHGLTATKSASVSQEANVATYAVPVLTLSYSDIAASGGSVTPSKSFTQSVSYTSGSTSTVTSGGTWSYSGTGVNTSTGAVSASSLGTTVKSRSKITTATASLTVNGKTGSITADVYQALNEVVDLQAIPSTGNDYIVYYDSVVPASGGTVSPRLTGAVNLIFSSNATSYVSANGSVAGGSLVFTHSYSKKSGILSVASNGVVTGSSLGTVVSSATETVVSATIKTTFTRDSDVLTDSRTDDVVVTQQANTATYGAVSISGGTVSDIPASGGSVSSASGISGSQTVSFTSGDSRPGTVSFSYSTAVSAPSLGTTVKSRTLIGTLDANAIGDGGVTATKSFDVYQEANTATYSNPSITASYGSDIPAGGGTVSLTKSFTQNVTYTSGSTGTVSSGGSWSYSQTSGSGLNTSTGAVTADSLGTTAKARTQVASVRVQLTVNSKTEAVMASAYQAANTRTWSNPTITTFAYRGTPAVNTLSAGADNRNPTLLATQTGTWTSGETATASLISSKTFTGGDVNTSTGNYTVTSLGNVVTARQLEATITVNITMNGKTASDSLSLYREANEVTYSDPIVTHTSPISVAASAGQYQLKPNFTQRAYYTSGSETPILSGSFTYAVKTALTGFSVNSGGLVSYTANPSVSARNGFVVTITGSGNDKSGTTDVTFNQEGAEPTIQVSLNGTSYGSSVTVNLEGKSASEVSVYVKTNDTFDVS